MSGPWEFDEARDASRQASAAQRSAEDFIKEAAKGAALAEEAYRVGLARTILQMRSDGKPATLCKDLARGDTTVARLKRESMIAEGVRDAAVQAAWRRAADRRDTERFTDWSMRRELAEAAHPPSGTGQTFGGRRAA